MRLKPAVLAAVVLVAHLRPASGAPTATCPLKREDSILLVDTELRGNTPGRYRRLASVLRALEPQATLRRLPFSAVDSDSLAQLRPAAIILGPQGTPWWEYPSGSLDKVKHAIATTRVPILGICGGHQLLALAHGAVVQPIGCPVDAKGYLGCVREKGFFELTVLQTDPLLEGLGRSFVVWENHAEHVRADSVAVRFAVLASSPASPVQVIRRPDDLAYGVQFHPEAFTEAHGDGKAILRNFLAQVRARRCQGRGDTHGISTEDEGPKTIPSRSRVPMLP